MKTRTYAEILARQGEIAEALAIYRHLLAKSPGDAALLGRIAELEREGQPGDTTELTPPSPRGVAVSRRRAALETLLHRIRQRRRP
jgi:hypothetical protein